MLRESSHEDAQNAYALAVQALVTGRHDDITAAAAAVRSQPIRGKANIPQTCDPALFQPLHEAARECASSTLSMRGMRLPFDTSEQANYARSRANRRAFMFIAIVIVVIIGATVAHAMMQRCLPVAMCVRGSNRA